MSAERAAGALALPEIETPGRGGAPRRLPVVPLGIIGVFVLMAILAPVLSPADPLQPVAAQPLQAAGVDGGRDHDPSPRHRPAGPRHAVAHRLGSESAYGHDPVHPVRYSALGDLVPNCIKNVTVLDAVTQEELDAQIASIEDPESILWVGSPGMAAALSRRFVPAKTLPPLIDGISSDVLVVIGSANLRSHRQADQLQEVSGVMLLRGPRARERDSAAVLRRIAQDAARELQSPRFGALIATGGDTMEAILDLLNVREFEILQELDPGFPLGRARLSDGRSLLLAMKAGGFGSDDALERAVARIRGAAQ